MVKLEHITAASRKNIARESRAMRDSPWSVNQWLKFSRKQRFERGNAVFEGFPGEVARIARFPELSLIRPF